MLIVNVPGGRKLDLPGRASFLPEVFLVERHSKVSAPHGQLVTLLQDTRRESLCQHFKRMATFSIPRNRCKTDSAGVQSFNLLTCQLKRSSTGIPVLQPSKHDRCLLQCTYGTGLEKDDVEITWAIAKSDLPKECLDIGLEVRDSILGPPELIDPHKARRQGYQWAGGVAFEHSARAKNV
ncbi:hypothetical protein HGRIS_012337 [Hohenbuehelia grisea]|uniref:Uncharacterized protein n=1 Tax=Hohenbuehelia grisea TaxID=104357 RepID=A0ABR3IS14_9AGAR